MSIAIHRPHGIERCRTSRGAAADRARNRAAAEAWARDLLSRGDWVILDTETTGLAADAEVVQVGILAPDGAVLLDTLVRPQGRIPPEATAIHGLTDRDVAAAPLFPEVYEVLDALARGWIVVAYGADFDRRVLAQTAARYAPPALVGPRLSAFTRAPGVAWECAMRQYARYVGEWNERRGDYRWQRLPAKAGSRAHQAIADCRATLAVIRQMAGG